MRSFGGASRERPCDDIGVSQLRPCEAREAVTINAVGAVLRGAVVVLVALAGIGSAGRRPADAEGCPSLGFVGAAAYPVGAAPISVVVADFNGDGYLDLASANDDDNTVSILLNTGTGDFASP